MWHVVNRALFFVYLFLRWFNWSVRYRRHSFHRFRDLENSYRKSLAQGMQKTAEETALNMSSEIDTRAFMWTFDCLDEDHELERFFSGLPGFRSSKVVEDPLPSLTEEGILKLYWALRGLLDRSFSSDLLPAPIKDRRALICAKAVDPEHAPVATPFDQELKPTTLHILNVILSKYQHSGPVATGIAKVLRGWGNSVDEDKIVYAHLFNCKVLATSQAPHDDSWYNFASYELGFPETSLRDYAAQGDSLSLVILIHIVREQFIHFRKLSWSQKIDFSLVMSKASKFDAKDTSSELQHNFCALWNQIVNEAQDEDWNMALRILMPIRNVFLSLHQDTDSAPTRFSASTSDWEPILRDPSSYPVCKVPDHSSDSTPHTHDDGVSATLARAIPPDPDITAFVPFTTSPDPLPLSAHSPRPVFTDTLPLDNQVSVPGYTQVICHMTTEGRRIPTISLSPVIEPSRTMRPSTTSPSPTLNASASPSADIAVRQTTPSRFPSDDLNVRSSSSPAPILDVILPKGLFSFQAVTRLDRSSVYSSNYR